MIATSVASIIMSRFCWKKPAYFEKTPRLITAKMIRETGNRHFMRDSNMAGINLLKSSTTRMGTKTIRHNIRTIPGKEISMVCPRRNSTRAGSVSGTMSEEITTITKTKAPFARTRLDIKGATTPVDMPVSSRTATAYDG